MGENHRRTQVLVSLLKLVKRVKTYAGKTNHYHLICPGNEIRTALLPSKHDLFPRTDIFCHNLQIIFFFQMLSSL